MACSFLGDNYKLISERINELGDASDAEIRTFWLIVGLIEAGHLNEAKELVGTFAPKDRRIPYCIFLGAALLQTVRIASPEEKQAAEDIMKDLSNVIARTQGQHVKELKTVFLEVRKGNIELLES